MLKEITVQAIIRSNHLVGKETRAFPTNAEGILNTFDFDPRNVILRTQSTHNISVAPFRITVIPWRDQSRCSDSKAGVSSVIFWWQYQSVEYGSLPTTKGVVTSVIFWWQYRSVEYGSLPTTKGVVTSVIFWWRS
ncbi:hypothetical protein PoB_001816800 [Plakobranchus ocellatus]|uniref:Uncharacterized protein n=1 Tax=Plakobranchus ocellatus TaxID=259542 RepID=A0AAV3ZAN9_9GAST|nr:hypothetical protein PoB_001816800 [Plakobranchus ocellatus]